MIVDDDDVDGDNGDGGTNVIDFSMVDLNIKTVTQEPLPVY